MAKEKYWATEKNEKKLGSNLVQKVDDYYNYLTKGGRLTRAQYCYRKYYTTNIEGIGINNDDHTRIAMNIAEIKNLFNHIRGIISNQPATYKPVAVNNDSKSQYQTKISENIVDYYSLRNDWEQSLYGRCLELACVTTEAFASLSWDSEGGQEARVDPNNNIIKTGDVVEGVHSWDDVIRDVGLRKQKNNLWYILRWEMNKYELAAKYPKKRDEILGQDYKFDWDKEIAVDHNIESCNSDQIYFYEFRHKKCSIVPNGKLTKFLEDGTILENGDLPYPDIMIFRLSAEEEILSNFGFTQAYDLICLQEGISKLYSAIMTNQSAFGYQNLITTKNSGIHASQLSKGLRLFKVNEGADVRPLDLLKTPPEMFSFIKILEEKAETLSGVNSVIRGNPQSSLESGAALALIASNAIQYMGNLQKSYTSFTSDIPTGLIDMLKIYADYPMLVEVAGVDKSNIIRSQFTKNDLTNISRVRVEQVHPLAKSLAGRVDMADKMYQKGDITKEQYYNVITTGRIEPILQGSSSEVTLIKAENERLRVGESVVILAEDKHELHMQEHKVLLNDPIIRLEPSIVQAVTDHMRQHAQFAAQGMGQGGMIQNPDAMPPGPPMGPMPGPADMPSEGLPAPSPLSATEAPVGPPVPIGPEGANMVSQPSMPDMPEGSSPQLQAAYQQML